MSDELTPEDARVIRVIARLAVTIYAARIQTVDDRAEFSEEIPNAVGDAFELFELVTRMVQGEGKEEEVAA